MQATERSKDPIDPPRNQRIRRAHAALRLAEIGARVLVSHGNAELLTGNNMSRVKRFVRFAGRPVYRLGRSDVVFLDDVVAALKQVAAAQPEQANDTYTEADALAELGCARM